MLVPDLKPLARQSASLAARQSAAPFEAVAHFSCPDAVLAGLPGVMVFIVWSSQ